MVDVSDRQSPLRFVQLGIVSIVGTHHRYAFLFATWCCDRLRRYDGHASCHMLDWISLTSFLLRVTRKRKHSVLKKLHSIYVQ
jgi:hypothetical protein